MISTDPPYYDNIGYADLSDFFYIWLRRNLRSIYPELFTTILVPKGEELVATPARFAGDKQKAKEHFEQGLQQAFLHMQRHADPSYPLTIYYAFKQQESKSSQNGKEITSTGWETMLNGLIHNGFQIVRTWPIRTELKNRTVALRTNALSTSIVLVCRPRTEEAPIATRREFLQALRQQLPKELQLLQDNHLAATDLDQAILGVGISIFSGYQQVLESNGEPMSVRTAMILINQVLAEVRNEGDAEFDADTRWALRWFERYHYQTGEFGEAEVITKTHNTSMQGLVEAGIVKAEAGKVRLLKINEYPPQWSPQTDKRFTLWEAIHYLLRAFENEGEMGAARLFFHLRQYAPRLQQLAYRLYDICEEKGWHREAFAYHSLLQAWPRLLQAQGNEQMKMPVDE